MFLTLTDFCYLVNLFHRPCHVDNSSNVIVCLNRGKDIRKEQTCVLRGNEASFLFHSGSSQGQCTDCSHDSSWVGNTVFE